MISTAAGIRGLIFARLQSRAITSRAGAR